MSMPNIPDIEPRINITLEQTINLLLASIAFEELGLSHIINAEGEKMQDFIEKACSTEELLQLNESVNELLKTITKKEMLLQYKLEDVSKLIEHDC